MKEKVVYADKDYDGWIWVYRNTDSTFSAFCFGGGICSIRSKKEAIEAAQELKSLYNSGITNVRSSRAYKDLLKKYSATTLYPKPDISP